MRAILLLLFVGMAQAAHTVLNAEECLRFFVDSGSFGRCVSFTLYCSSSITAMVGNANYTVDVMRQRVEQALWVTICAESNDTTCEYGVHNDECTWVVPFILLCVFSGMGLLLLAILCVFCSVTGGPVLVEMYRRHRDQLAQRPSAAEIEMTEIKTV